MSTTMAIEPQRSEGALHLTRTATQIPSLNNYSSVDSLLSTIADLTLPGIPAFPRFSPFGIGPANDRHEEELQRWKEQYKNGKVGSFDGQRIVTLPDVSPAEEGDTSRDIALALRELESYHERAGTFGNRIALDMGCGNGALALSIATFNSFAKVIAVDNHEPAVENVKINRENSPYGEKIAVFRSDLMSKLPRTMRVDGEERPLKIDLIVFNHPYYPREGSTEFGLGKDGGQALITRFFEEISPFVHDETEIIMPFSSDVDRSHNPAFIAESLGYSVTTLRERVDSEGITHTVYRFVKRDCFEGRLPTSLIRERGMRLEEDTFALAA